MLIACASCAQADELASVEQARASGGARRVVSLAPSNTELLYSIDAGDCLVGVSTHCDYPPEAKKHEKVGSFTFVNLERLAQLKPDAVLLVSGQEQLAGSIRRHNFNAVVLNNDSLSQIPVNLRTLGNLTDRSSTAAEAADSLSRCLSQLASITASLAWKPTVFYCVWPQPLLSVGGKSFLNEVITATGGKNIAENMRSAYPQFSIERLVLANPDVIVLPHEARGQKFLSRPPWTYLSAVANHHVFFLPEPAKDNLARPTPRIVDGLYWLATRLHPELRGRLTTWYHDATIKPAQK
jgi:iron complex transport system substrate-binding protein